MLLAELERHLLDGTEGGVEIGRPRLGSSIQALQGALPDLVKALQSGEPSLQLSPREVQIDRMLAHVGVATEYKATNPAEDLTELWDDLYRTSFDLPAIDPTSRDDRLALAVLVLLGIVPARRGENAEEPLKRISIPARGDALYALAGALGA
jgi:hypothetical protein